MQFFGLGSGVISPGVSERVNKVVSRACDSARLHTYDDPAGGPRYWLSCENSGNPFDAQRERAVLSALAAEGLWDGAVLVTTERSQVS